MANPAFVQGAIQGAASDTMTISLTAQTDGYLLVQANSVYGAITGATWDGVAMTLVDTIVAGGGGDGYKVFGIATSATMTSKNIYVENGSASCLIGYMYFSGVKNQSPTNMAYHVPGSGNNPSKAITTTVDNSMVVYFDTWSTTGYTAGANTTQAYKDTTVRGQEGYYSTAVVSPAGSFTINLTGTYNGLNGWIATLEPAAAASTRSPGGGVAASGGGSFAF